MNRKLSFLCGAALIAVAPLCARADDATTSSTTTTTTTTTTGGTTDAMAAGADNNMSAMNSMTPMQVTGTVLRYYVDQSGYVTAMDVQTANGVQMVRFSPSMGQRLYAMYPVGTKDASVYVMNGEIVGTGATAPVMKTMSPPLSDVELLETAPYINAGAKLMTMKGTLSNLIIAPTGEVVGMVLDNNTLVRVPRESRSIAPGYAGTARVTPLFKGSDVEVTGYPEAPRYGVLSSFANRVVSRAIVVNGRAVGPLGFPMMSRESTQSLFKNINIGGADKTPDEVKAMGMGYSMYSPSSSTMQNGSAMDASHNSSSTGTNMTTGTGGASTGGTTGGTSSTTTTGTTTQ